MTCWLCGAAEGESCTPGCVLAGELLAELAALNTAGDSADVLDQVPELSARARDLLGSGAA